MGLDLFLVLSDISVMTEIINITKSTAASQFILYWGDMGNQWGVNRSVAQIHALLYLSSAPLNAEQIAESLSIARSNVSNSIKELVSWRLIRRVPVPGDRREHYEAEVDVWEMGIRIAQGRKEREIDPATQALRACVEQAKQENGLDPVALERMQEMQTFLATADTWFCDMLTVPRSKLVKLMKMGTKVVSLLNFGGGKKSG